MIVNISIDENKKANNVKKNVKVTYIQDQSWVVMFSA